MSSAPAPTPAPVDQLSVSALLLDIKQQLADVRTECALLRASDLELRAANANLNGRVCSLERSYLRGIKLAAKRFKAVKSLKQAAKAPAKSQKGVVEVRTEKKPQDNPSLGSAWQTIEISIQNRGSHVYAARLQKEAGGFHEDFMKRLKRMKADAQDSTRNADAHLEGDPTALVRFAFEVEHALCRSDQLANHTDFIVGLEEHGRNTDTILLVLGRIEATAIVTTILSGTNTVELPPFKTRLIGIF